MGCAGWGIASSQPRYNDLIVVDMIPGLPIKATSLCSSCRWNCFFPAVNSSDRAYCVRSLQECIERIMKQPANVQSIYPPGVSEKSLAVIRYPFSSSIMGWRKKSIRQGQRDRMPYGRRIELIEVQTIKLFAGLFFRFTYLYSIRWVQIWKDKTAISIAVIRITRQQDIMSWSGFHVQKNLA